MMHMVDAFDLRMRCDRHGIEATHLAHLHEGRLQLPERLHVVGAAYARPGEDRQAVDVLTGTMDLAKRPSPRRSRRASGTRPQGVDIVARETVMVAIRSAEMPCGRK